MTSALILAAGLGTRMRPLTLKTPKPLVTVRGKALLDYAIEAVKRAGVTQIVVNVHYLPDQIIAHLKNQNIIISDEREGLLDSGGGVVKALSHLSDEFFVLNADTFWLSENDQNLKALQENFNPKTTDFTMLLANQAQSVGFTGKGDFTRHDNSNLTRQGDWIYAGAFLTHKQAFKQEPLRKFSLNSLWDKAIMQNRLNGVPLEGKWYHIGDLEARNLAELLLK